MGQIAGLWDKAFPMIIQYGIKLAVGILIYVIGKKASGIIADLAGKAMSKAKLNKTLTSFCRNIIYYCALLFVVITALGQVGIQTNSFVALIGASGLAVGLALQGALANFAAGVMIILFQPFQVGDTIEAAGAVGTVTEIQVFSTILGTTDNKNVIIPNAKITADKIIIHKKA
jgi:small conductance mechanosensitive channel